MYPEVNVCSSMCFQVSFVSNLFFQIIAKHGIADCKTGIADCKTGIADCKTGIAEIS